MTDKRNLGKPAAWAITQNEKLWREFDAVADRSVIIEWSLGGDYRSELVEPGDRAIFWITGPNGGLARLGFVLDVWATPRGYWKDSAGKRHKSPFAGQFFLPPFPNRRYLHRSAFTGSKVMADCELLGTAAQRPAPLRVEAKEWAFIQKKLVRFDESSFEFRAAWP